MYIRVYKTDRVAEPYVTKALSRSQRSLMAQLRFGILPIRIETGRYVNLKPEDRICPICDKNAVETEEHFLFECDALEEIREGWKQYIIPLFENFDILPLDEKFKIIMSEFQIKRTSEFVDKLWQQRKHLAFV